MHQAPCRHTFLPRASTPEVSSLQDGAWQAHRYAARYALVHSSAGTSRLVAGVPGGAPAVFERLASCLAAPYYLLYVLHTPRGEAEPGRYQSPEVSAEEFHGFIARFGGYLSADARFDLWVHSPEEGATVVWDRHNELFAYGPLERFAAELRAIGFETGRVEVPVPHQHHYRPECDAQAVELLTAFPWTLSPLRSEDEQ